MKRLSRTFDNLQVRDVPRSDSRSGDNVGNDTVRELLNFVLESQLALLHPSKLKLVAISGLAHPFNLFVEAPVLNLEHGQHLARIIVIHVLALQEARTIVTLQPVNGKPHVGPAKLFVLLATNGLIRDLFTELSRVSQRKEIDRWTRPMPRQSHLNTLHYTR